MEKLPVGAGEAGVGGAGGAIHKFLGAGDAGDAI